MDDLSVTYHSLFLPLRVLLWFNMSCEYLRSYTIPLRRVHTSNTNLTSIRMSRELVDSTHQVGRDGMFALSRSFLYLHLGLDLGIRTGFCTRTLSTNSRQIITQRLLSAWQCAGSFLRFDDCYVKPIIKQITACTISKIAEHKTRLIIFPHGRRSF